MSEIEKPELHVVKFTDGGTEWRERLDRQRGETRKRYLDYLSSALTERELPSPGQDLAAFSWTS